MTKEVQCAYCAWIGTLDEAWEATESVQYEDGSDEDGRPYYEEDNAHYCPHCHKEGLEVFDGGERLGSMYSYG